MTDKAILFNAINKAKENGFSYPQVLNYPSSAELAEALISDNEWFRFIFSHDFAKAFWGEELHTHSDEQYTQGNQPYYNWKYHLQQMVLEEEPLKYLEQFLDK